MKHCEILIPGHYFCDLIFSGIPGFPALGTELYTEKLTIVPGGCLNTITALRRLGVHVGWMGVLGSDPFSHVVDEWIAQEGIDRAWLTTRAEPFQRVTVALSYPADRAFVTYVDPPPDLLDGVRAAVAADECDHLHFAGLTVNPALPEILSLCKAHKISVSMDCQHREDTLADPLVRDILSRLDCFMPNASEALRLTETTSLDDAAQRLRELVPLLVIKDGANGVHAWEKERYYHVPARAVEVVDSTGAGDVFNAGFLTARRAGSDLLTCLHWGNVCGGLSTTGYGGAPSAPTRAAVEAILKRS